VYHSCIVRSFDTQNELNNLQNEDSVIGYDWLWHTLTTISISEYVRHTLVTRDEFKPMLNAFM